jgi:hypothetical protein
MIEPSDWERFTAQVFKIPSGCWMWTGGRTAAGYGRMRVGGVEHYAHRLAFAQAGGQLGIGQEIDHVCRTRHCVNPQHLRAVSHKTNMENQPDAERTNNTSGHRGVTRYGTRWKAYVTHNYRRLHVGVYDTAAEAAEAARLKRAELFTTTEGARA